MAYTEPKEAPSFSGNVADKDPSIDYGSGGGRASSSGSSSSGGNTVNVSSTNSNNYSGSGSSGSSSSSGGGSTLRNAINLYKSATDKYGSSVVNAAVNAYKNSSGGSSSGSSSGSGNYAGQPGYDEYSAYKNAGYDYLDFYVANGSFAADGSRGSLWTDAQNLSEDDQAKIQQIRSNPNLTAQQKNDAANAIRKAHGYTIDTNGYVTWQDASAGTGVYRGTRAGDNLFGTGEEDPAGTGVTPGASPGGAASRYAGAGGYANYLADLQAYPDSPQLSTVEAPPSMTRFDAPPELQRMEDAPQLQHLKDAPQLQRYEDAPELQRYEDAPELQRLKDAPQLQEYDEAPELSYQRQQAYTRDLSDLERAAEGASGDKLSHLDESPFRGYLDQWLSAAQQQAANRADYTVQQGVNELQRNQEDAAEQFQQQRNAIDIDEAKARNNQALYAAARGDRGGVAAAQYDAVANAANQNRQTVRTAQTKLATDTARQIADLRAQGEFQKADQLLSISQNYLSELMSLSRWAAEYNLGVDQFNAQLNQWLASYRAQLAQLDISQGQWAQSFDFQQDQYQNRLRQQNIENARETRTLNNDVRQRNWQNQNDVITGNNAVEQQNWQNNQTVTGLNNQVEQQNWQNSQTVTGLNNQVDQQNWQNGNYVITANNDVDQQNWANGNAVRAANNDIDWREWEGNQQTNQLNNNLTRQEWLDGVSAAGFNNDVAQQGFQNNMNLTAARNGQALQLQDRADSRDDAAWSRYLQSQSLGLQQANFLADRDDTDWQRAFTERQYEDSLTQQGVENQQAKDKQLASWGEKMISAGVMPGESVLKAMGLTEEDATNWMDALQRLRAISAKSGGSGGSGSSGKPEMTEAAVRANIAAGNLAPKVLEAYEYYYGIPYSTNSAPAAQPQGAKSYTEVARDLDSLKQDNASRGLMQEVLAAARADGSITSGEYQELTQRYLH